MAGHASPQQGALLPLAQERPQQPPAQALWKPKSPRGLNFPGCGVPWPGGHQPHLLAQSARHRRCPEKPYLGEEELEELQRPVGLVQKGRLPFSAAQGGAPAWAIDAPSAPRGLHHVQPQGRLQSARPQLPWDLAQKDL